MRLRVWGVEQLFQLSLVLIGGAVGIVAGHINNRANFRAQQHQFNRELETQKAARQREHGEQLYSLFSRWAALVFTTHVPLFSVMKGSITYDDYLDLQIKQSPDGIDHHRVELLIFAYFPEFSASYQNVMQALRELNAVILDHNHAYKAGRDGRDFIQPFEEAQKSFEKEADQLKQLIVTKLSAIG